MTPDASRTSKPRLGISACLLGKCVRYDGGHRRDRHLTDTLGKSVEWVPVCPEVECGLGVPREVMWLVGNPASPRLMTQETGVDQTDRMKCWVEKRLRELEKEEIDGFVFKANSPSCGLREVEVYDERGGAHGVGVGLWARAFTAHFPDLPTAGEGDLHDPRTREDFLGRIISRARRRSSRAP